MELWTLGELAERVEAALADYPGQANGRVRAVPDQRAIRWYTTTGLVDRPAEMRGRTALYGRRHLLQLVAIKRRQSQGQTLAQIQSELAGATNQTLEPIAALPPHPPKAAPAPGGVGEALPAPGTAEGGVAESDAAAPADQPALPRARFWADRSPEPTPSNTPHPTTAPGEVPAGDLLAAESAEGDANLREARHPATAPLAAAEHNVLPTESAKGDANLREAPRPATAALAAADHDALAADAGPDGASQLVSPLARDLLAGTSGALAAEVAVVTAVRIADGVTVVLDQGGAVPDAERLAAAAGPFLAELRRQGLLTQSSGDES